MKTMLINNQKKKHENIISDIKIVFNVINILQIALNK